MNTVSRIIEDLAVPIIALSRNLRVLAANSLAEQAFTGLTGENGFDSFSSAN